MLNKKLFDDPKDAEIARLKMTIEKFKEYDKKRKEYYAGKMQRLGELESFVQEMECGRKSGESELIIAKQKITIGKLNRVIQSRGILDKMSDEDAKRIIEFDRIMEENKRLKSEIKSLHKAISEGTYIQMRTKIIK